MLTIGGYALAQALAIYSDDNANRLLVSIEPHRATLFLLLDGKISLVRSSRVQLSTDGGCSPFVFEYTTDPCRFSKTYRVGY